VKPEVGVSARRGHSLIETLVVLDIMGPLIGRLPDRHNGIANLLSKNGHVATSRPATGSGVAMDATTVGESPECHSVPRLNHFAPPVDERISWAASHANRATRLADHIADPPLGG
jgi:hypothetical protein